MDLPNEILEIIFINLLTEPSSFWVLARVTRWSLRVAIKHVQQYRVKDIHLDKILPRLARYMPNLQQLSVVPLKSYFHSYLSDAALETLQKFSRLTYLDIGYARAPNIVAMLTKLTQLQCINNIHQELDVTRVKPELLADLTLHQLQIRNVPPLTALTNLRRLTLTSTPGPMNVTQLFTAPLTRVTHLRLSRGQEQLNLAQIFPNLESIDGHIPDCALSTLTRLTALKTYSYIWATKLRGLTLEVLSYQNSDLQSFTEFTCLTSLRMGLSSTDVSTVNLVPLTRLARLFIGYMHKDLQFSVSSRLTRVTLMSEGAMRNWSAFTALQRLTLNYVPIYTARDLRVLTNLERLTLKACIALEAKSLQYLSALPYLSHLTWQGAVDEGLTCLTSCTALTSLHLRHCTVSSTHVNQLHQLRRLVLFNVRVGDDYLSQLYQLEQLHIVLENYFEPLNLTALQQACNNSLTALVIESPRHALDESFLHGLKQLTQLKYLHVQYD